MINTNKIIGNILGVKKSIKSCNGRNRGKGRYDVWYLYESYPGHAQYMRQLPKLGKDVWEYVIINGPIKKLLLDHNIVDWEKEVTKKQFEKKYYTNLNKAFEAAGKIMKKKVHPLHITQYEGTYKGKYGFNGEW